MSWGNHTDYFPFEVFLHICRCVLFCYLYDRRAISVTIVNFDFDPLHLYALHELDFYPMRDPIYIQTYIYIYSCVYLSFSISLSLSLQKYIDICVCVCVYIWVWAQKSTYTHTNKTHPLNNKYIYKNIFKYVYIHIYKHMYLHMYIYICICIHKYVYQYTYINISQPHVNTYIYK